MMKWTRSLLFASCVALAVGTPANAACPANSNIRDWVPGGQLCLAAATSGGEQAGEAAALIVLLHGDTSSGGPADYLFDYARRLSQPGAVAVALLRPGFNDKAGRTSQGNSHGRSDSYTPENVAAVGGAIEALKKQYRPKRTLVLGHSGGAAIAGVLAGKNPGLFDAAILVACPCDIARWRKERGSAWPRSESPSSYGAKVPASASIVALTGTKDDNTRPAIAQDYIAGLAKRGVRARFQAVEEAGHSFGGQLQSAATAAIKQLLGE